AARLPGVGHYRRLHQPRLHGNRDGARRFHVDYSRRGLACLGEDASPAVVPPGHRPMTECPWDKRIARAAELEHSHPPAAELLRFYRQIAEFQKSIAQTVPQSLAGYVKPLLVLVARVAPDALAQAAEALLRAPDLWTNLLESPATPSEIFLSRILLQPHRETLARRSAV